MHGKRLADSYVTVLVDNLVDRRSCLRADPLDLKQLRRLGAKEGADCTKVVRKSFCAIWTNAWETLQDTSFPRVVPFRSRETKRAQLLSSRTSPEAVLSGTR
jgi:hypothetical protein